MKDITDKQLIEIINAELEVLFENASAAFVKAIAENNNLSVAEMSEPENVADMNKLKVLFDGYAMLCNVEALVQDMIETCIK